MLYVAKPYTYRFISTCKLGGIAGKYNSSLSLGTSFVFLQMNEKEENNEHCIKNIFFHGSYAIFFIFGAGNLIFPSHAWTKRR